jgi:aspartyl-tRNA synthetase
MKRILISNLAQHANGRVKICGYVENIRDQKHVQFIVVRDHTGKVQVVNDKSTPPNEFEAIISDLTRESAIEITGTVEINERVKLGGLEVKLENLTVASIAETPLPIVADSNIDQRMDYRWLDLRRPEVSPVFRVQTTMEMAMREWWIRNGFRELHSPKLTASSTESGSELFSMPYFGTTACLAQSPQFCKQMAMAAGFDRVFEIGPVFRANPSFTSRHDTEFTSIDMEVSWIDSHEDVMSIEEQWLAYIIDAINRTHGDEIERLLGRTLVVPTLPFPRVTMDEAYELLLQDGHVVAREHKGDLDPEGERRLAKIIMEKYGHEFVFVKDYPITARPFYHMRYPDAPYTTKSFDLLWGGLEITTGAQREHRYEILTRQAQEKGLELSSLQHYLNFFRYGVPPHGGMGIGLTRLLMIITGMGNVREVTFLYRGPNRLTP